MPEPAYSARSHIGEGAVRAEGDSEPGAVPPCLATIDVVPDGDRMSVTVWGELDLGSRELLPDLHEILNLSGSGIDLALDAVGFCDCSGLNMLLDLRMRALGQGKTVTVRSSGTAVARLLDLTGAGDLFADPATGTSAPSATHDESEREDTDQELRTEVAQLRRAMRTRPTIDLARGILMASFGLSPEAAWSVLVRTSQNTNTKLHHLAQELVGTIQGRTLPEAVRQQLAAAVASTSTRPADGPTEEDTPSTATCPVGGTVQDRE